MLKIVGGEFRSRALLAPPDHVTSRPYGGRVREALFNLLRGWFEDAVVLDLFAGVGTIGLEAVSRGAREVFMVERDRKIHRLLEQNIEMLGCGERVKTVHGDAFATTTLLRAPRPADLIFVDPPYAMMTDEASRPRVMDLVARCVPLLADPSFLILRSPIGPDAADWTVPGLDGPEPHSYGLKMWVMLYAPPAGGETSS